MGFVAILGVVSLIGMVIRNSVILIGQIDTEIAAGQQPWNAVIVATEHRLRPILLTAAAAILGMIPIAPTVFWGPMAYAVMGGLVVATLLTLVFLPALYVAWFRIKPISEWQPTISTGVPALGYTVVVAFLVVFLTAFSGGTNAFAANAQVTPAAIVATHDKAENQIKIQADDIFQSQSRMAAVDRTGPFAKSSALAEPFGLNAVPVATAELLTKWTSVEVDIRSESEILVHCRENPDHCPSAARTFLAIVAEGRAHTGRARIGVINRAINLAIRAKSDLAQWGVEDRWTAPLATLTTGFGDCEDYAIAKYVALTEAGVAVKDVRLIIVRDLAIDAGHAVVAVRLEGGWIMLDNRRQTLVDDGEMRRVTPLFELDHDGVKQFAPEAMPDLPYIGALRTH
jgi:predicted transglutaminase-like cysteine proteinase